MRMPRFILVAAAAFSLGASSASAATTIDFTGAFSPGNWTYIPNSGSISSNATTYFLVSGNSGFYDETTATIAAPSSGIVKFDWSYGTNDWSSNYDPFGFVINGSDNWLANDGNSFLSGTASFAVTTGQSFGFKIVTSDGAFGSGYVTLSNFSFSAVPEPGNVLGSLVLISTACMIRIRPRVRRAAAV